ncbi:hypothetical protein AJ79_00895 [Helicocarpus griseus UAMH5409]|uniref:Alpha/beta hydrolase fold-3 domain-containing protein n=1 Tax=Helicocarpus griseus UAMH5409 TaxID=1447875 RepID=A0A2B7Y107_9EURO|nr:hypothetical protein AJ79_00895 [Helicocarpus griseus UAMH5409]
MSSGLVRKPHKKLFYSSMVSIFYRSAKKDFGKNINLAYLGGGYVMSLNEGHLEWMTHIRKSSADAGVELSICLLEYTLAPERPYPRQFHQAIMALNHLQASGRHLSNIIIGGDSAGGHLSLCIISALMHPYPDANNPLLKVKAFDRLKGCFVISPLLSWDLSTRSYSDRFSADVLAPYTVQEWGNLVRDNSPLGDEISQGKGWGMALDVPEEWWDNMDVVDQMLVTGGHEELFRDHIYQFIDLLRRRTKTSLASYVALDEAHDGPLLDFCTKSNQSKTTQLITEWVISTFSMPPKPIDN